MKDLYPSHVLHERTSLLSIRFPLCSLLEHRRSVVCSQTSSMATSESDKTQVKNDPRDQMPRYTKDIEGDITSARKLLEEYSKVPPDQVDAHIHSVVCSLSINFHVCHRSSLTVCSSLALLSATKPGKSTHTLASVGSASLTSPSPFTPSTPPCLLV